MIMPFRILREEAERNTRFALSLGNAAARAARHTRRLLAERRCLGVTERLWLHLRSLAEGLGTPARDSRARVIDPPLRQQDLADLVGASRETVSKSMAELASLGLVRTQHGRVVVTEVQPSRRDRTHAVVTA